ncbi:HEAT repeat domain-containing protein [Candidatus Poribacteria bacterium]
MSKGDAKLSGKCYVGGVLYRPALDAVRKYYSRTDILDEIFGAMRVWHVRLEPGEKLKHRWFNVDDRDRLQKTLMRLLDRMDGNRELVKFPYFRIDGRRHEPVTSWEDDHLWGLDLMMEKDGRTWRECWDAVTPMIEILHHFGVHYWLKYTGHHSLHVMIPAESFPTRIGELNQVEYVPDLYRRMVTFFARICFQPVDESGFHGARGTNMPYSLNEDTGLLNYPVLKEEIQGFDPVKAHPDNAKTRSFWRKFPDEKRGSAEPLIQEVLRPFHEQSPSYDGVSDKPPVTLDEVLEQFASRSQRERKEAVIRLPWFNEPEAKDRLFEALHDRSLRVRKAAIKALAGVDDTRCEEALRSALAESSPKLTPLIQAGLRLIASVNALRESYH